MSITVPVITPIDIDDIEVLQRVALQAYREHYLHLWYDGGEWYMHKNFSTEQLGKELNDSNAQFFIVYNDNVAVGFVKINIDAPFENENNALELERIYFIKSARGKGIGTAAVQFVLALAESMGKKIVWLKVMDTSAAAIAFYKKPGFEICGTYHLDFPQMKEELRGMYIMKKIL